MHHSCTEKPQDPNPRENRGHVSHDQRYGVNYGVNNDNNDNKSI